MKITYIKTIGFRKFEGEFEANLYDITEIIGGNAKGKTNILYAIIWGFLGTNLTGDDKVYIGNNNSDNCYVEIHFIDNFGNNHVLKRLKNKYNNKKNFLLLDEKPIIQENLTSYYKDKKLFLSIMNSNYFINRTPSEQKILLDTYLPNIDITEIYNKLDNNDKSILGTCPQNIILYIKELNNEKKVYEDKIKLLQGKLTYAENIITEKLTDLKIFNKQEELSIATQKLALLKSNSILEKKQNQLKIIETLNNQINLYQNEINKLDNNIKSNREKYILLKKSPISYCPTCKQQLSNKSLLITMQQIKTTLDNSNSNISNFEHEIQKLKKNIVIEKCKLYALGEKNPDEQNNKIKEIENQIKLLEHEKQEIEQYNLSINIKKELIQKSKNDIEILSKNINNLYKLLDCNKKSKKIAQQLFINYIEAKMHYATKYLTNVNIKYYTVLKDSGEIKDDFIITYKGNDFKNLSRSETIATALEISNMLNKISNINLPLFIDDSESCTDYDFINTFSNDTQLIIAKVKQYHDLTILNNQKSKIMHIAA